MLFFKCCTVCDGDLVLEAGNDEARLKCMDCGAESSVPSNTHLFNLLCKGDRYRADGLFDVARQPA